MKTKWIGYGAMGWCLLWGARGAAGATYTVTSAADSGAGTLRWAITEANGNPGADMIRFNLPSPYRIQPTSALPAIAGADPLTVDGTTQPGYAGVPLVVLDGSAVGMASGLMVDGSTSVVIRALSVVSWSSGITLRRARSSEIANCTLWSNQFNGVVVQESHDCVIGGPMATHGNRIGHNGDSGVDVHTGSSGIRLLGNWIGNDGVAARPNSTGVLIQNAWSVVIGGPNPGDGNLISGNDYSGISLSRSARDVVVIGNWIGVDETGLAALGNSVGILIEGVSNRIGGAVAGARNVISGNGWGVRMTGTNASHNTLESNWIGLGLSGAALPNGTGVQLMQGASSNLVGGAGAGAQNVVSGNAGEGIQVSDADSVGNQVLGNYIGTDVSGAAALGNGGQGLSVFHAPGTRIGGGAAGAGNVISANALDGIFLSGASCANTVVAGNRIGVSALDSSPLGNGGFGVRISDGPSNHVGTALSAEANWIAHNGQGGIGLIGGAAVGNQIGINSIHDNVGLGIDLGNDGVTPNDLLDADLGPNRLQNYPVLASVSNNGSHLVVRGHLGAQPLADYRVAVYGNWNCDASGHGEGETYLGDMLLTTDPAGMAAFTNLSIAMPAPPPNFVTATARHVANGDSSEFSAYAMLDSDGDGMPDGWENRYFGSPTGGDPAGHADADGISNLEEFHADTDPTDPDSFPRMVRVVPDGTGYRVDAMSSLARRYRMELVLDIEDVYGWYSIHTAKAGTGGVLSWYLDDDEPMGFFRCRVLMP